MDKTTEDIENILVELKDNNIDFIINTFNNNGNLYQKLYEIHFKDSSDLFTVRDQIKEYIQDILKMLDDYCKENDLDLKVVYRIYVGPENEILTIDKLLDMSKNGLFWKKSLFFFFEIYKNNRIDNFSSFKTKNPSN